MKYIYLCFLITTTRWVSCTIDGIRFLDVLKRLSHENGKSTPNRDDPCNPLYWYPKHIPDYCQYKKNSFDPKNEHKTPLPPLPVPIPVPIEPYPMPAPLPYPVPMPAYPLMQMPGPLPPVPVPMEMAPIPYGIPIQPTGPMLPILGNSHPYSPHPYPMLPSYPWFQSQGRQMGLVPGIEEITSPDGGINILSFSDVYSDAIQKHREKYLIKDIGRVLRKYRYKNKHGRSYNKHSHD